MSYVLSIDQSTQSTKAILCDQYGKMIKRVDKKHRQMIDESGYVSHNPNEIYENVLLAVRELVETCQISHSEIKALGISNQRETTVMWDSKGIPLADAVVWQCARASEVVTRYEAWSDEIYDITGLVLSPYFPASKMRWLIEYVKPQDKYFFGTIDTWLVYRLTNGKEFKTDASNASRTQLFDIKNGMWSQRLCEIFEIPMDSLPEVCDSNSCFGYTDFEGFLEQPIPIHAVLGDSHAALFGQGCHYKGQVKTTLGTGSSIMMNIGNEFSKSNSGLTTSLAWRIDGTTEYVFEGNINYAGAVITWMQNELGIIDSPGDTETVIKNSNMEDETVLIPAFSGLSAPYWDKDARAMFYGMSRTTTKNELIKAGVESIAYQIKDVLQAMSKDCKLDILEVKTDGGPSKNTYLMQFLSDIARTTVLASRQEELSAIGAAYLAGLAIGLYRKDEIFQQRDYNVYNTEMEDSLWKKKMSHWKKAVDALIRR